MTIVGPDGDGTWGTFDAHLTVTNHTIVTSGISTYSRFTTDGDTLLWRHPLDGLGYSPANGSYIAAGPDSAIWIASTISVPGWYHREIVLIRLGEDTTQTVYYPFADSERQWYCYDFDIDANYQFHFLVYCDTMGFAYVRLDSAMQRLEWRSLWEYPGFGTLQLDSSGNCLIIFDDQGSLFWAYRSHMGTWTHLPAEICGDYGVDFSIVVMDSERFAFTATTMQDTEPYNPFEPQQVRLYTYGYPPDAASPVKPVVRIGPLTAYPNPFSSVLQLRVSDPKARVLTMYDILGRVVYVTQLPPEARSWTLAEPAFSSLPSGTYYLSLKGTQAMVPIPIIHIK